VHRAGSHALSFQGSPTFGGLTDRLGIVSSASHRGTAAEQVLHHLSALPPRAGFVTREYSPSDGGSGRRYFTVANAMLIDAIRETIHEYVLAGLIDSLEHEYLLATLIAAACARSNTTGQMSAYMSDFQPRARRRLHLQLSDHPESKLLPLGIIFRVRDPLITERVGDSPLPESVGNKALGHPPSEE
jgi:hypothetical protein